jgi:endoglucanase
MFDEPWPNCLYTIHDYALPGFVTGGPYPGPSRRFSDGRHEHIDRDVLERTFLERSEYMRRTHTPVWVGEFGPVYTGNPDADAMRYHLLRDQLDIYERHGANWAIWTYKDIGLQGVVHTRRDSEWNKRIEPVLEKKERLGVDAWGSHDDAIRHVMQPLEDLFAEEFPDYDPFPFGRHWMINRLVRHILFSEPLLEAFAACFDGLDEAGVERLIASFSFENCAQRKELAAILAEHAPAGV